MTRRLILLGLMAQLFFGCGESSEPIAMAPSSPDLRTMGRERVVVFDSVATALAVDALTLFQSNIVYQNVSLWNDLAPDLTGTIAEGCQGVGTISESIYGTASVYQLMSRLGDSGQSTVVAFARNLDPLVAQGIDRCRDSLEAQAAPQSMTQRNPEVLRLLNPEVATMPKFHALRQLLPGTLPPAQRAALKQIRDRLTYPANGQKIQKVLKARDVQNYLNGSYDPAVFGFQTVLSDVDNLVTAQELIEGLRLDYPGGFQGETVVGTLVYFQDTTFTMTVPYRAANGGDQGGDYPFTGNGFTATTKGNAVPEWILPKSGVNLQNGAQLFLVDNEAGRTLLGTFENGHWVSAVAGHTQQRSLVRKRVARFAQFAGSEVYVISEDEDYYYLNASVSLGLLEENQVGPEEYRGKVRRDDPRWNFPSAKAVAEF